MFQVDKIDSKQFNLNTKVSFADVDDICYKVDDILFCCCELKNGSNNILVYSTKQDIRNIKRMFAFIIALYLYHDIEYITVTGSLRRYLFVEKMFRENVVRDPTITDERVLYCKLNSSLIMRLAMEIMEYGTFYKSSICKEQK